MQLQRSDASHSFFFLKKMLSVRPVMLQEDVDMVAGDFSGAKWRRK